jgi:tRNA(Ile)-lysidine synthase
LQENLGYTHVLTAHHLDDQLETFLINLGRGSGLKGLRGITTDQIIRPLLPFSKDEIHAYAEENKIEWRADSSNEKDDYLRNQLRHHVIPQWKKTDENLLKQVSTSFENLSLAQEALNVIINDFQDKHFIKTKNKFSILLEPLQGLKPQNYFLHALFSPYGFNNVTELLSLIQAQSGKFLVSNTHRLIRDREQLILTPIEKSDLSREIKWIPEHDLKAPIQISIESEFVPKNKYALLNADMLKYPLILRKYKEGDYFCPVGMKGKKKLSKYFKDQKFSLIDKETQWVLCSEDQIVWVVGHRVDARFAGNSETDNPLILKSF